MSSGPNRRLQDDERELWKDVTRSIVPLRPQTEPQTELQKKSEPKLPATGRAPRKAATKTKSVAIAVLPVKAAPLPALAPLGRRMKQRLSRGAEEITGRLDLHGRTQAQAHNALLGFLRAAQARGEKNVLVITGKGQRGDGERGVLKRQVPMWLKLPEFRELVVGFEEAHVGHGGQGALYVRLRKAK